MKKSHFPITYLREASLGLGRENLKRSLFILLGLETFRSQRLLYAALARSCSWWFLAKEVSKSVVRMPLLRNWIPLTQHELVRYTLTLKPDLWSPALWLTILLWSLLPESCPFLLMCLLLSVLPQSQKRQLPMHRGLGHIHRSSMTDLSVVEGLPLLKRKP